MPNEAVPAVVVESLVKTFKGSVRALDGVSFEIPAGTVLGLLGPNGAGKTTIVRVLTTLLRPDSGHASVGGVDVLAQPEAVRRLIGLAGQYAAVDDMLTGRENLVLLGSLNHVSRQERWARADELLERFDLTDAADRLVRTYSGGMRRRLDLAAALVARPPILFLDEPTNGLDPSSRIDLWTVVADLVAGGTTVLLTTQYLEEADRLADQICVIDHGRVIAEGTAAELKTQFGHTVVEVTFDSGLAARSAIQVLAKVGQVVPVQEEMVVRLPADSGPATLTDVVRHLDAARLPFSGLQLRQASLDDVFLALTGHVAQPQVEQVELKKSGLLGRRKSA